MVIQSERLQPYFHKSSILIAGVGLSVVDADSIQLNFPVVLLALWWM